MHIRLTVMLIFQLLSVNVYSASDPLQQVQIATPFLELHTGPGSGYPVLTVLERGSIIEIMNRRANWFKVRDNKNTKGWVHIKQLSETRSLDGEPVQFEIITQEAFSERSWEWGVMGGDFGGAPALTTYGAYLFNPGFAIETSLAQSIGDISSSLLLKLGFVMQPFPEWSYSPYFRMSTGFIDVRPSSITIQPIDQTNQFANISLGIRTHLTQKIILRLEYSQYVIFSANKNNDNNEEINEWKAGFAVFF